MNQPTSLLTLEEVADILRVDTQLVQQLVDEQAIEAFRIGAHLRFRHDSINAFLRTTTTMPDQPAERRSTRYTPSASQVVPKAHDFRVALESKLAAAAEQGLDSITIRAGDFHAELGGYPGPSHRMPVCCAVMRELMTEADEILAAPPSGNGASLQIRYHLSRRSRKD